MLIGGMVFVVGLALTIWNLCRATMNASQFVNFEGTLDRLGREKTDRILTVF